MGSSMRCLGHGVCERMNRGGGWTHCFCYLGIAFARRFQSWQPRVGDANGDVSLCCPCPCPTPKQRSTLSNLVSSSSHQPMTACDFAICWTCPRVSSHIDQGIRPTEINYRFSRTLRIAGYGPDVPFFVFRRTGKGQKHDSLGATKLCLFYHSMLTSNQFAGVLWQVTNTPLCAIILKRYRSLIHTVLLTIWTYIGWVMSLICNPSKLHIWCRNKCKAMPL